MTVKTQGYRLPFITTFILLFLFLSCQQFTDEPASNSQQAELDSISSWISVGRDRSNELEKRKRSLFKAYESTVMQSSDSIRLKYLSKIQWSFLGLNDSLWFRKTNQETNVLARKMQDSTRIAGSFWDLGVFHNDNNVVDSAYYNYLEAKKIYEALGNRVNAGKLEFDMAGLQADTKNYTSAEVGVIRAIELLKSSEEYVMLFRCYNLLGIISKDLGDYDQALTYYASAETYIEELKAKTEFEIGLLNNIGTAYKAKGDYAKAVSNFKRILSYDSLQIKRPNAYARVLNNLASSQYKLDLNDTSTESLFLKSLKIRDSLGDNFALAGGYKELSAYYLEKRDTAKALTNALKAKSYAESSKNNERLLEALALLMQVDANNASSNSQRYVALSDSLQKEERKIRNKFARIRFETNEVVARNELLSRQRQLWSGIAVAIALLGLAGFIIINQREKNKTLKFKQAQQASNQEIFNLMLAQGEKVEEGKKMEQKRVSEELHDGVLGKMLGARMMLLGLNKKTDPEAIAERAKAISILQDVEGEVRSISHELSHAAYQKIHNFILSIKDLVQTIQAASNITIDFSFTDELDWDALSGEIKINLYRMVQESLQNSVKHAECQNIVMKFYADEQFLKVDIADDGKGFVQKRGKKGIGMRNMASRIKKVDGTWDIKSELGKGTEVTFIIPLVSNDNENAPSIAPRKHNLQEI